LRFEREAILRNGRNEIDHHTIIGQPNHEKTPSVCSERGEATGHPRKKSPAARRKCHMFHPGGFYGAVSVRSVHCSGIVMWRGNI